MNERARARGHARLRADEHGRVVCAHSIFFELRRKGVAGHRPRALLVWGVPHHENALAKNVGIPSLDRPERPGLLFLKLLGRIFGRPCE